MILVNGATGNMGGPLVRELHALGAGPVRALTRDPERTAFPAGVRAVRGDLARPESLKAALRGVRSLFHPALLGPDAEILRAARRAGVEHVVLVTSLTVLTHPHLEPARNHRAVERQLQESGMAWTILRPTQFASNALWWAETVRAQETVRMPYPDTALPTVHPADVASVARVALTEPGHRGLTHELTGPAPITPREQIATLARVLGREVPFAGTTRAQAHREFAGFLGDDVADAMLDLLGGDMNEGLRRVRDTVTRLTGAPGRTFAEWAEEHVEAFRP
ncbi:NAD(P)H-binding protein [Streptomyces sp. NPDC000594]|uniref:SDR family oxidoreductase n=1 Tax=Streptomyces sp. NPDC000594 TaxID=3154261 RepID=UPI003317EBD5